MQEMSSEELKVNRGKAYKQFMDLYNFVSGAGFVCNLPSHGNKFQDLVYVANMGIYLPHIKNSNKGRVFKCLKKIKENSCNLGLLLFPKKFTKK